MKFETTVIEKRSINHEIAILKLDKKNLQFKAGQYVILSFPNEKEAREYSIYSGENDNFIEILFRLIPEGTFSNKLFNLKPNDKLIVDGPHGFFVMKDDEVYSKKHILIATGTGISPFKSYIKSFPDLQYKVLHGITLLNERIEPEEYIAQNLVYCISREQTANFNGRVSQYLETNNIEPDAIYHLCGNSAMIHDVTEILEKKGVLNKNIRTEVFF